MPRRSQSAPFLGLAPRAALALAALLLALLAITPTASASKQAVDFFGGDGTLGGQFTQANDVAVNDTGAGVANPGDVYAIDSKCCQGQGSGNRIERFGRDDNGTPADTADDSYFFISAWGADVDSTPSGGSAYEICTLAADCQAGVAAGGNGALNIDGLLQRGAIAIDQDTSDVYVSDAGNSRINVYDGTGAFLRSFGYDVDATTPGTGYEVCPATDVCKAGLSGSAAGQIGIDPFSGSGARGIALSPPDANPATGTVFLADSANRRIDTYDLDGTAPASIGSAAQFDSSSPRQVTVDSRGILYASNRYEPPSGNPDSTVRRYDTQNANGGGIGFLSPILGPVNELQRLNRNATAGQFTLSFGGDITSDLNFDATSEEVEAALAALPSISAGNVSVRPCFCAEGFFLIRFTAALAHTDVAQIVVANGTSPLTGTVSVTTVSQGHGGVLDQTQTSGLAIDPDSDGPGPDTDVLYVGREDAIQQFGPINSPGLSAPPGAEDDRHNTTGVTSGPAGLAVEPPTGRLYAASSGTAGPGVYVLDNTGPPPTAGLDSCDNVSATSANCHATIDPNGPPATRYHFEYSVDGSTWLSLPESFLGTQEDPQPISAHLEPLPIGLEPNTTYHVRVVAGRKFATPVTSNEITFPTLGAPPLAETDGAPVRTTATAQLNGRVTPLGSATAYHFEYGLDQTYGQSTPTMPAGSGQLTELVGEEIIELAPDTTYHYRLVAENGVGSPALGADMTVHTRATEELPGQSDAFPGPPGSDRAWEQVSIADSSGNPVLSTVPDAFSDDGDRAAYGIAGGTPISSTGSLLSLFFAQRTPAGWQTSLITPPRERLAGSLWFGPWATSDLSAMTAFNKGSDSGSEESELWRLAPGSAPALLLRLPGSVAEVERVGFSIDGSRVVASFAGAGDPAYPAATRLNLYDVGSATPHLLSLIPGNLVSPCPARIDNALAFQGSHWVSDDGSVVYFETRPAAPCEGGGAPPIQLYLREVEAAQTKLISGPPLSGPDCGGGLIKATPAAAFFATSSRLDPADPAPASCGSGAANDVYRYDVADGSLKCVTCVAALAGFPAGVDGIGPDKIAVADDGSRLYFSTQKRLLPGAPPDGQGGVYRLDVASGELAFIAQIGGAVGTSNGGIELSPDGSVLAFASKLASLNPLGGAADNGATTQYYRYDDRDRSLLCVSCPTDGSPPTAAVPGGFHRGTDPGVNQRALSADGQDLAFATPTPLLGADQNTPGPGHSPNSGTDLYEWREGRLILLTDGLTNWAEGQGGNVSAPQLEGMSPSGNDLFFRAAAAYTPDAPDALPRLYDARIGGGIAFAAPPPPCDLETCQGTPKGPPSVREPGTATAFGSGNVVPSHRCPKGKARRHGRCVPKHHKRRHRRAHHRAAGPTGGALR